jgi:predicted dehydrogenase
MRATRRFFLGAAAAGLAAARAQAAPSDRIRVGFIGCGGMGTGRLRQFLGHADVEAAAVCDVDRTHLERAAALVEKETGRKPAAFADFRRLLERGDIDAVMIATPDHWHALPAILACQAGKDVFVEKPFSWSVGEGRRMVEEARRRRRVTQMGNHIHNDLPNYRRVVELVRSGLLGRIVRVHCGLASNEKSIGSPPDGPPPPELDYDFWLGPAPKRPYNPNRSHGKFRYFWDYSGGYFADFWCHYADVAYWALDLKAPRAVSAAGGRWLAEDNAETPDVFEAVFEYPGPVLLTWTQHPRGRPGFEHMGSCVVFEGTEATLVTNYSKHEVWVKGKPAPDFPRPEPSIPDSPGHIREFLDAIKARNTETTCNFEYSHRLNKGALLANLAFRLGARLEWDDERERVTNHREANSRLTRRYRKPWKLA